MPNDDEISEIKRNFEIPSKCPKSKYWTEWGSFTNLSDTDHDGNDYETLDRHRSKNFSICEHPTEIDARMVETEYDWAYSDSVLIHHSQNNTDKLWNIGISRYGYLYFLRNKFLNHIHRFICVKKLQKNKKCDDFEVRFCCPENNQPKEIGKERPVFNETVDLEQLHDINDLRK